MAEKKKSEDTASKITTDHEVIKGWVESRGGRPATVKRTHGKDEAGIIRIDFPGYKGGQSLEPISWNEFFEQFDSRSLAFLYQDRTAEGKVSRFNRIISRETAGETERARKKAA